MENASKALILAAEVLLGVMILSVGVYLFGIFGNYSEQNYKQIEDTQIAKFNNQFLKYNGKSDCTIHDITSLANLAQKHNIQYELEGEAGYSEDTLYVQIDLIGESDNLEKKENDYLVSLIKENDLDPSDKTKIKYYKCTCTINEKTKRVNHVVFKAVV